MSSTQKSSSIRKIRQSFTRSIRKSQIEKIQKQKRQAQMKIKNPITYLPTLLEQIISTGGSLNQIHQFIKYLWLNIKIQEFADLVEKQQLIQIILLKLIELIDPWNLRQKVRQRNQPKKIQNYQICLFPKQCLCLNCSENSTSTSQFGDKNYTQETYKNYTQDTYKNYTQETYKSYAQETYKSYAQQIQNEKLFMIEIENNGNRQIERQQSFHGTQQQKVISQFIDFLNFTFDYYKVSSDRSSIQIQIRKFHGLFVHTPEILEGILLDILTYSKSYWNSNFFEKVIFIQILQKMEIIFKIMNSIAKIAKVCCFDDQDWRLILNIYTIYFSNQETQIKNENPNTKEIKQLFCVLYKSYFLKDILQDSKNTNSLNKLVLPVLKQFNSFLIQINSRGAMSQIQSCQSFWNQLQFILNVLSDLKFVEKQLNNQLKLILGEFINLLNYLVKEKQNQPILIQFMYLSPQIARAQQSDLQKKCKLYGQKIIEILYLQMELSEDDFHRIIQMRPEMKQRIQQIIDADMY